MIITIPDVLSAEEVKRCRQVLDAARWTDGRTTAGAQAQQVKQNLQLPADSPAAIQVGDFILDAIGQNPVFIAAALPLKVLPPMFNCYRAAGVDGNTQGNHYYGNHIDGAIRVMPGSAQRLRTDISCTLFLSAPEDYDGGELVVEDTFGTHAIKLPAGHMVVYPGTSLHRVTAVTRGERLAAFFWVQSFVRSDDQRRMLYGLDTAIQGLTQKVGVDDGDVVQLTGVYHNLLRLWAQT